VIIIVEKELACECDKYIEYEELNFGLYIVEGLIQYVVR